MDDNPELFRLAEELIQRFIGKKEKIQSLKIVRQFLKIDVLLLVNEKYAVIIEDKVHTTTHQNQESLYREALEEYIENNELKFDGQIYKIKKEDIRTVYFKTGFHYDYDQKIMNDKLADVVFDLKLVITILMKYENKSNSELLNMYLAKLRTEQNWFDSIQVKYEAGVFKDILKYQYGQYLLAKDIFGLEAVLTHGTSNGRPWTSFNIINEISYCEKNTCSIFVRIDTDKLGYKISIRQYDRNPNIKNEARAAKIKLFDQLWYAFQKATIDTNLPVVMGGNNGGYYESEIGKIYLTGDQASDFQDLKNELPPSIRDFQMKVKEI